MIEQTKIIFLGKKYWNDPLFRMYFETLTCTLHKKNCPTFFVETEVELAALLHSENSDSSFIVNFFYKDQDAIKAIERLAGRTVKTICFTSDIESYDAYRRAYSVSDAFVCPSAMHKEILGYVYDLPVYTLIEAIDPILGVTKLNQPSFGGTKLVWFGFPESYLRSMPSLEATISEALSGGCVDSFTVISLETLKKQLPREFLFLPYATDKLANQLREHDFSLLSHIPLDLHLNTLTKSANKALSAIAAGLIPICSNTPNYSSTLSSVKLDDFLFHNPRELLNILRGLKARPAHELQGRWQEANEIASSLYSVDRQSSDYVEIVNKLGATMIPSSKTQKQEIKLFTARKEDIKFRFYWRQQIRKLKDLLRL
jgi:glycosyltransferase involved in cell wall biosynthesis